METLWLNLYLFARERQFVYIRIAYILHGTKQLRGAKCTMRMFFVHFHQQMGGAYATMMMMKLQVSMYAWVVLLCVFFCICRWSDFIFESLLARIFKLENTRPGLIFCTE